MIEETVVAEPAEASEAATPATEAEGTTPEGTTPEAATELAQQMSAARWNAEDAKSFVSRLGLPKEIEHIVDREGNLRFVVPINGKRYIASPEDVFKGFNLQQAGYQILDEGKRMVDDVRNDFEAIRKNPKLLVKLSERLGVDFNTLAEQVISEQIEDMKLSPQERDQRKREAIEREDMESQKEELARLRLEKQEREQSELMGKEREKYNKDLVEAMTKHGFKKYDSKTKSHILAGAIGKMMLALKHDKQLSAQDAVYLAKQDWQNYTMGVFDDIDETQIAKIIPKRIIDAIRKADLKDLESSGIPPTSGSVGQRVNLAEAEGGVERKRPKKNMSEFFQNI